MSICVYDEQEQHCDVRNEKRPSEKGTSGVEEKEDSFPLRFSQLHGSWSITEIQKHIDTRAAEERLEKGSQVEGVSSLFYNF